jgi:hypothetical protein
MMNVNIYFCNTKKTLTTKILIKNAHKGSNGIGAIVVRHHYAHTYGLSLVLFTDT